MGWGELWEGCGSVLRVDASLQPYLQWSASVVRCWGIDGRMEEVRADVKWGWGAANGMGWGKRW